jgi:hypothetical protein
MTISKVLDQTVRMYRANFVPLATLGAIHAFVSLPLIFLDGKPHGGMTLPQLMGMFAFVALVAMAVLLPWQSGAAISASLQILGGQPPQVGTSLGASWRRLGALIGLGILSGLAGGLGALLFVIPGFYIWFGFSFGGAVVMDQHDRVSSRSGRRTPCDGRGRWRRACAGGSSASRWSGCC